MIEIANASLVDDGCESSADQIAKLREYLANGGDLEGVTLGFRAASAMAAAATKRQLMAHASKRKLSPERYFAAEAAARTKEQMAELLDVSTQALHNYEKNNSTALALLRDTGRADIRDALIAFLTVIAESKSNPTS
jgi:hypothetical protein